MLNGVKATSLEHTYNDSMFTGMEIIWVVLNMGKSTCASETPETTLYSIPPLSFSSKNELNVRLLGNFKNHSVLLCIS